MAKVEGVKRLNVMPYAMAAKRSSDSRDSAADVKNFEAMLKAAQTELAELAKRLG